STLLPGMAIEEKRSVIVTWDVRPGDNNRSGTARVARFGGGSGGLVGHGGGSRGVLRPRGGATLRDRFVGVRRVLSLRDATVGGPGDTSSGRPRVEAEGGTEHQEGSVVARSEAAGTSHDANRVASVGVSGLDSDSVARQQGLSHAAQDHQ